MYDAADKHIIGLIGLEVTALIVIIIICVGTHKHSKITDTLAQGWVGKAVPDLKAARC